MKKSFVKSLSAFLALVLILSALPMAAFAAEVDEHEHTDSCCSNDTAVMPAMAPCEDDAHVYAPRTTYKYTDCGGVHRVDETILIACIYCARFTSQTAGDSYYADHSYTKTAVGTDPDSNLPVYKYTCVCGNSYYGN